MSMNLILVPKVDLGNYNHSLDILNQTPTKLTYAVMRATTVEEQFRLYSEWYKGDDEEIKEFVNEHLEYIKNKLNDYKFEMI